MPGDTHTGSGGNTAPGATLAQDTLGVGSEPTVRHLRQILLWPLRVLPQPGARRQPPWQAP